MNKKNFITVLLLCLMFFGQKATAQEFIHEDIRYSLQIAEGNYTATALGFATNTQTHLVIPEKISMLTEENPWSYEVTAIANAAFKMQQIQTLMLPATITSIGGEAFVGNPLQTITYYGTTEPKINESFTMRSACRLILPNASSGFNAQKWGVSAANIQYGGGTTPNEFRAKIDRTSFNANANSGTIDVYSLVSWIANVSPDNSGLSLSPIAGEANTNKLVTMTLQPNGTTTEKIFTITFNNAEEGSLLQTFTIRQAAPATEPAILVFNGVRYSVQVAEGNYTATALGFADASNSQPNLAIPEKIVSDDGMSYTVTAIGDVAFKMQQIQTLMLPPTITSIGGEAFVGCPLKTITYEGTTEPRINESFTMSSACLLSLPNASSGFNAQKWGVSAGNIQYGGGTGKVYHQVTFLHYIDEKNVYKQKIVSVEEGLLLTRPVNPTRPGYIFDEWYTSSDYLTVFDFAKTKVTSSFTVYAKWTVSGQNTTYIDENGITYEITPNGAIITAIPPLKKLPESLEIPASISVNGSNCPVVIIENQALMSCEEIVSLTIPASVTTIENGAFLNCVNLTKITYNGVWEPTITGLAFAVTSENPPARVLSVPNASGGFTPHLWGENVTIGYGIKEDTHTVVFFKYTSDEGVPVQENVVVENDHLLTKPADPTRPGYTFDGWYTDPDCTIIFDFATRKVFSSFALYAKWTTEQQNTYTDKNGIMYRIGSNGATAFGHVNNAATGNMIIPASILVNGVNCPVREIDHRAFMNYSITALTLPASISSIGSMAFSNCLDLIEITYNGTVEPQINSNAFYNINAEGNPINTARTLNVPNASGGFTATKWGSNVTINYGGTATTHQVTFFKYIDENNNPVQEIVTAENDHLLTKPADPIRPGYTFSGWYTNENYTIAFDFATTKVFSSFTLYAKWIVSDNTFVVGGIKYKPLDSAHVEVVGYNADYLPASFTIPAAIIHGTISYQVMGIAEGAFVQCQSLKKVIIADGITYIKEAAFAASGMTEITIPASILTIGTGAYRLCTSLASVTFLGTATPVNMVAAAGGGKRDKRTLYAPNATEGLDKDMWDVDAIIYGGEPPVVEERTEANAVVTWAFVESASLYYLYLYADASKETLIGTYVFDANGNLIERLRSISVVDRATFSIEGLESDKSYYIEVEAQNEEGDVIATQISEIPTLEDFSTSITTPFVDVVSIYAADGCIIIENLPASEMYSIYTISGVQLFSNMSSNTGTIKLPVSKGIYIVKTKAKAYKLMVN